MPTLISRLWWTSNFFISDYSHIPSMQWRSEGPAGPTISGGPAGLKGLPGAHQEEEVAVTPWPGAQTSCLRGGLKSSLRYCIHEFHTFTRSKLEIDYISCAQCAPTDLHYSNYSKISIFEFQKISVHPVDKIPRWILASTYTPRSRDRISRRSDNHKSTSSRFQTIPQGKVESTSVPSNQRDRYTGRWLDYISRHSHTCMLPCNPDQRCSMDNLVESMRFTQMIDAGEMSEKKFVLV